METLDNPSYFSLPEQRIRSKSTSSPSSAGSIITIKRPTMGTIQTTIPLINNDTNKRSSFKSLLRTFSGGSTSSSNNVQLQLLNKKSPSSVTSEVSSVETDFNSSDMMYYNVPKAGNKMRSLSENEPHNDDLPPRYYHNLTSTENGRRRHSIGAFYKEKPLVPPRLIDLNANKLIELPTRNIIHYNKPSAERWLQQGVKRKCQTVKVSPSIASSSRSSSLSLTGAGVGNMKPDNIDDILIISQQQSQVANLWVNYLKNCYDQVCNNKGQAPYKIHCIGLDDLSGVISLAHEERMSNVKLQVIVLCPSFLQRINETPYPTPILRKILQPERVLVMLLGVSEDSVTEQHRNALGSFTHWRRMQVRDKDSTFVSEFVQESVNIISNSILIDKTCQEQNRNSAFSLLPKKVKHSHNKVIILLNDPLDKEDRIRVTVIKNNELLRINTIKRRNPFTLHFIIPDVCLTVSMLVSVQVEKNGVNIGTRQLKCESRMRELDVLLRSADNPLDFMSQTLGFSIGDREQIDTFLVSAFQRNVPPHFSLLQKNGISARKQASSPEEMPTLLHFAARHGFEKLAWQLMESPGSDFASELKNCSDLTPADMADAAGHAKLAAMLRGYTQMNELSNMYSFLKMAAEGKMPPKSPMSIAGSDVGEDYHMPRPLNETYQIPPAARPVKPLASPLQEFTDYDSEGYLEMLPAAARFTTQTNSLQRPSTPVSQQLNSLNRPKIQSTLSLDSRKPTPPPSSAKPRSMSECSGNSSVPPSPVPTTPVKLPTDEDLRRQLALTEAKRPSPIETVQDELAEIIHDFKNNILTIQEVEKLVENWKNRNDVQQSYKEKQEQLNEMRDQYDKIQEQLKQNIKQKTAFEKFKGMFKGKSKEPKAKENEVKTPATLHPDKAHEHNGQRPPSSLSLQSFSSSSSSERMSTVSGGSLGDSGTHSDPEDRKVLAPPLIIEDQELHLPNNRGMNNYQVPPPPRAVREARNKPKFKLNLTETYSPYDKPPPVRPRPEFIEEDEESEAGYLTIISNSPPVKNVNINVEPATPNYTNLTPDSPLNNYINCNFPVPPALPKRK